MKHSYDHEHEDQLDDLNKAIELDPNFAEALFARANLYAMDLPMKSGGFARAVEDLSRFLELKPNDASARHNRAHYYDRLGQYDNAIADYTTLIEGDTDFTRIIGGKNKQLAREYFDRGWAYHGHKKDYARAISDYTAALQLEPQMEGARRLRGECYESTGQSDKALEDFAVEKPN
jgi:tetratricopeptide (TPR) repeat protein